MSQNLQEASLIRIVDDDEDLREALSFLLASRGWKVRAWAGGEEFLRQDAPSVPGCLLLDIRMPGMSGLEVQAQMRERRIALPVIFLTGHADVDTAVETLKAGALDFLQKPVDGRRLAEAVEAAAAVSLARTKGMLTPGEAREVLLSLSPREQEVIRLLRRGVTNREIAERLALALRTVHGHRNNIYHKLRVHSLQEFREVLDAADADGVLS